MPGGQFPVTRSATGRADRPNIFRRSSPLRHVLQSGPLSVLRGCQCGTADRPIEFRLGQHQSGPRFSATNRERCPVRFPADWRGGPQSENDGRLPAVPVLAVLEARRSEVFHRVHAEHELHMLLVPAVQVRGLREVGVALQSHFAKAGLTAKLHRAVEVPRSVFVRRPVAGTVLHVKNFSSIR